MWSANAAKTEADFKDAITKLARISTCAAEYLRPIPAVKWAYISSLQEDVTV